MDYALVTGASTGIGYASAAALAERGLHVFAGVRSDADAERIRKDGQGRIEPILLDVTNPQQIADASAYVSGVVGKAGLRGLVNNAGIGVVGPLEFIPMEDFELQLNVNVKGLLAVTQAFLPLLRLAQGRLCFISSTNGFLSPPFTGPYAASKFAVEALGDALRVELMPWNIRVSLVEPGAVATPIWEKSKVSNEAMLARMPAECQALYGKALDKLRSEVEKLSRSAAPVNSVARRVVHAITARRPKTRYLCGRGAIPAWILARWLPDTWRDAIINKVMVG